MLYRILSITGIVMLSGCAMSGAISLAGSPNGRIAPDIVLLDTTVSAPSEHLLDDFGSDPSKAHAELIADLAERITQHFRGAKLYLVGGDALDSTTSFIRGTRSWVLRRPKLQTLKRDFGETGRVLILSDNQFGVNFRPMGAFERFWYFDAKNHIQREQKCIESGGVAGMLNLRGGELEWAQHSHGYADFNFALTRMDWTRAFDRRLEALGESNGSGKSSGRGSR